MKKDALRSAEKYTKEHQRKKRWYRVVTCLACVVVFCTVYALILPAITLEKGACEIPEHTHSEACYTQVTSTRTEPVCTIENLNLHQHDDTCYDSEGNLTCGYADYVVHRHDATCYDEGGNLWCPLPEIETHEHTDSCYSVPETGEPELICDKTEVILHEHTSDCFDDAGNLICGKIQVLEHQHTDACFETVEEPVDADTLTCTLPEDENHTHGPLCYGNWELTCGMEEHTHSEECQGTEEALEQGNLNMLPLNIGSAADPLTKYAIVGTEKSTSSTLTYPEVDQTFTASITGYNISVDVLAKSFEREVTLKATEQAWDDLEEDVQKQLTEQGVSEENSTSLDLHFEDADGNEVEPVNKVNVKFTIREENVVQAVNADEGSVLVYHAEETKDDNGDITVIDVKQVASTNDDTVMAENNSQATAEFETDSFSTFTLRYFYGWATLSNIYVVDMNGNGIGTDQTYDMNINSSVDLSTVIAKASPGSNYTFVRADINTFGGNDSISSNNASNYSFVYEKQNWKLTNEKSSYTVTNKNIYLVYKESNGIVTVTFDANGGSTTPDPRTMSGRVDSTIILPDYTGTRSGYTFRGWAEANTLLSDEYHDLYTPGSTYTLPDDGITLYAVWDNDNYTNTTATFYIRLDGTIPAEPGSFKPAFYTSGTPITNTIKDQHWIVDTDGTKKVTTTGSKNGGDKNYLENNVTSALTSVPTNSQLKSDINNSSNSLGFNVNINASGELYVVSSTNSNYSANDLLYVHWYVQKLQDGGSNWHVDGSLRVKSKVSITYDGNPNSEVDGVPVSYQTNPGTEINIGSSGSSNGTVPTTTRTGYVFEGWNTEPDGSGTTYQNNDKFTLNEDTTLYAMWSKGYNRLIVNKKDESNNVLAGATFKLEEKTDGSWIEVNTGVTSDAGTYTYNNVRSTSIYRLTETYAPNGYETRNSFCFKVDVDPTDQSILEIYITDENGTTIKAPDWLTAEYSQASVSGGSGIISMNITDEQIKRKVIFKKVASDGTTVLSGAKFSLTKNDAAVMGVLKEESGTDGIFSTDDATLTYGTYTLTEDIAPSGYQKAGPITITLNDYKSESEIGMTVTGNATVSCNTSTSTEDNKVTTTYTYTVTVKDKPQASVTVIKTDNKTPSTKLGGVTFKLTKENNGSYVVVSITNVTDQNGQFSITDAGKDEGVTLMGLDDGTYKLTETQAPSGYIIRNANTIFTVENGQITLGENQAYASYDSDSKMLNIKNEAGQALPSTGGPGTLPYTLGGLMLVIASALMYGFRMRRRERRLNCCL